MCYYKDTLRCLKVYFFKTVQINLFLPLTKSVSLTEARYCVHAGFIVVDILVKLLVFHEEKLVEQFGGEMILLVEYHAEVVHVRGLMGAGDDSGTLAV